MSSPEPSQGDSRDEPRRAADDAPTGPVGGDGFPPGSEDPTRAVPDASSSASSPSPPSGSTAGSPPPGATSAPYPPPPSPPQSPSASWADPQASGSGQPSGPGYADPSAYGSPQYGYQYGYQPKTDDKAIWALVLAIGGWIVCPIVLHVAGWVLANQSLDAIRSSRGMLQGEGMAKAARIVSIIGLAIWGLVILLFIVLAVFGLIIAASDGQVNA